MTTNHPDPLKVALALLALREKEYRAAREQYANAAHLLGFARANGRCELVLREYEHVVEAWAQRLHMATLERDVAIDAVLQARSG